MQHLFLLFSSDELKRKLCRVTSCKAWLNISIFTKWCQTWIIIFITLTPIMTLYRMLVSCFLFFCWIWTIKNTGVVLADSDADQLYWERLKTTQNEATIERLKKIYSCSDRYFVYWYLACYDIAFQWCPWTEAAIHRASLSVEPETIFKIVDAARKYYPYYSEDWQPPEDYLTILRPQPWMDEGPNLFFERQYVMVGLMVFFALTAYFYWGFWG